MLILARCKPGERINIIGFDELNNLDVARKVAALMKKPLKPKFVDFHAARKGHDRFYSLSGEKLKQMGWVPPYSFDMGMRLTVKFALQNPEWR
jgi:dTDP-glucose 4,6-dehydratase